MIEGRALLDKEPSPGVKMIFPVRRKPSVSREEFIAYWFAHHMPATIDAMGDRGWGYIGTVFNAVEDGNGAWDGIAQMFLDKPLLNPAAGFGAKPVDSFHERAVQPYFGWATREWVVLDGADWLPVQPLTLNAPFPTSRSGFHKVVIFVSTLEDSDHERLQADWLNERAERIAHAMQQVGGFRYVVALSLEPDAAPYAGMEELYFHDRASWQHFREIVQADEAVRWEAKHGMQRFFADTEFVAIPL